MKKTVLIILSVVLVCAAGFSAAVMLIPGFRAAIFSGGKEKLSGQLDSALTSADYESIEKVLDKAEWQQKGNEEFLGKLYSEIKIAVDTEMEEKRFENAGTLSRLLLERQPSEENALALARAYSADGAYEEAAAQIAEMKEKYGTDTETALGEIYEITVTDATCIADGQRLFRSKYSDASYSEVIPATGEHTWDDGKDTVIATCIAEGERVYTCTVCEQTRTETLPLSEEHAWDEGTVLKEATCAEDGKFVHKCTLCEKEAEEILKATGEHTFDKETILKAATCSEEGTRSVVCSVCGLSTEETIPATGEHNWDDGKVTKEATCAEAGSRILTCKACGEEKTETIPATGKHSYVTETIKEATCTEDGIEKSTCSVCGKSSGETAVPALGHAFGSWKTVKAATTSQEGTEQRTCSRCGQTDTRKTAKLTPMTPLKELSPESYIGYKYLAQNYPDYLWAYRKLVEGAEALSAEIPLKNDEHPLKLDDFMMVYNCYRYDYPQHFWVSGSVNYSYLNDVIVAAKPKYLCTAAEKKTYQQKFDKAVASMLDGISGSMSAYERELLVHDRIVENASYDSSHAAPFTYSAYGNLVLHSSVCEGYAELFQYLMYKCGIPAAFVNGSTADDENHGWCIVWLDGTPYNVDVTWDDPVAPGGASVLSHEYLNCTTAYMKSSGHVYGKNPYTIPSCTATAMNYYSQKGVKTVSLTVDALKAAADEALKNGDGPEFECRLDRAYSANEVAAFFNNTDNLNALWRYYNSLFGFKSCLITRSLSSSGTVLRITLREK